MKNLIKKWWFWAIIVTVIIASSTIILQCINKKKIEDNLANIGKEMTDFYSGIENANTHINEFTYNYETGQVEYKPVTITLEMYNRINNGMTEKEVINILGNGEKLQPEKSAGFLINWGKLEIWEYPYFNIQINFNSSGEVISKSQLGLKYN